MDYEDEDKPQENADEDEEYEDSEEQDIELEEAKNIDPGEIDDIIEHEANPNDHQDASEYQEDDGDHQESEENIGIEELSGEEPGGEIDDIIEYEANSNEHQDDGDHQESEENIGIKELSREEPGVPSKSETYEPLDQPDNESDAGDIKSGLSNLDAEQEVELMRSEPRRLTRRTSPVTRLEPSMMGKSYLEESLCKQKDQMLVTFVRSNIAII